MDISSNASYTQSPEAFNPINASVKTFSSSRKPSFDVSPIAKEG